MLDRFQRAWDAQPDLPPCEFNEAEAAALAGALGVAVPDVDGWIAWAGGDCPLAEGTVYDAQYRDGDIQREAAMGPGDSTWHNTGHPAEIIAYRVVPA